jgi:hypothetical protein
MLPDFRNNSIRNQDFDVFIVKQRAVLSSDNNGELTGQLKFIVQQFADGPDNSTGFQFFSMAASSVVTGFS